MCKKFIAIGPDKGFGAAVLGTDTNDGDAGDIRVCISQALIMDPTVTAQSNKARPNIEYKVNVEFEAILIRATQGS